MMESEPPYSEMRLAQTALLAMTEPVAEEATAQSSNASTPIPLTFSRFKDLPIEIRIKIWEYATVPSIIRCKRLENPPRNVFSFVGKPSTLLSVSREARETSLLYGECISIGPESSPLIFSLKYDSLWFDAGWTSIILEDLPHYPTTSPTTTGARQDFIDSLPPELVNLHNIMVHPNWTEERLRPMVELTRFPRLESILVAADEKSIGVQSQLMLDTVRDIKTYYVSSSATSKEPSEPQQPQKPKIPRIAVGCLGWAGAERAKIRHGNAERELVAIFDDYGAMKDHLKYLREEEWRFTQERFVRPKPSFILKLQRARDMRERAQKGGEGIKEEREEREDNRVVEDRPPSYISVPDKDPLFRQ